MGKKNETMRKCAHVRDLIQEKKYVQALKVIDDLPLEEVAAIEDLYLFADMYEKAERLEKKKDIFFIIYERTHSRYILNRLLRLVIRMGDMNEARELFLAYEFAGEATLDTFELRYLLAKAEGEPRTTLISILEDLKKEEYTEEWGYQLARLYEQEGMRKECIQECRDLKLWFGEGVIVDKAMELMRRCEMPGWKPPVEEEIPELEMPGLEERLSYAMESVGVMEMGLELEPELEPEEVSEPRPSRRKKKAAEQKRDREREVISDPGLDDAEDPLPEEGVVSEISRTAETSISRPEVPEEDMLELPVAERASELAELASYKGEYVSEPVVVKRDNPPEPPKREPIQEPDEITEDEHEHISQNKITYRTLKSTIRRVRRDREHAHFVFAGGEERITLAVAKRITKELNHVGYLSAKSIVKISADKLNGLEILDQIDKLAGGCVLVTNAPEMKEKTVKDLVTLIRENPDRIVVMLSGPFDEIDCFLSIYPELSDELIYKVHM